MKIKVNGDDFETRASTIQELLGELEVKGERVAVELNLNIISRKDYADTAISEGDTLEVVNFVGGG